MKLRYVKTNKKDADLLVDIYDKAFHGDYVKYGYFTKSLYSGCFSNHFIA